ncbi:polyamine transporter [Planoprotostelium fungivorum]|uniref:Polyamine transporter n=1 Tax=Planoprotostelium fungivorum TaxID=1890364 RepID=A0A2P6N838_9EUKA|nr:polyamine transporter [Planoprotostelium fungivorum]
MHVRGDSLKNRGERLMLICRLSHTDPYLVAFENGDVRDPYNWPLWRKLYATVGIVAISFSTCVASGTFSGAAEAVQTEFGVSSIATTMVTALFLLGYAFGPLFMSPLSNRYGRKPIYLITWGLFVLFQIPLALAPNYATLLIFQILAGVISSVPLVNTSGSIEDIFNSLDSSWPFVFQGAAACIGPSVGAPISAYICLSLGWRWIFWIQMIFLGLIFLFLLSMPETSAEKLLKDMADRKNRETNSNLYHNGKKEVPLWMAIRFSCTTPFKLLFSDHVLALASFVRAYDLGVQYLFLESYLFVFGDNYDWDIGKTYSMQWFLVFSRAIPIALFPIQHRIYSNRAQKLGGVEIPEDRLLWAIPSTVVLPIGLFWFAWTSYPSVSWVAPALAGIPIGIANTIIDIAMTNYIGDIYTIQAPTANAASTFCYSVASFALPVAGTYVYPAMNYRWAGTLLAFIACGIPIVTVYFFWKGGEIRQRRELKEGKRSSRLELFVLGLGITNQEEKDEERAKEEGEAETNHVVRDTCSCWFSLRGILHGMSIATFNVLIHFQLAPIIQSRSKKNRLTSQLRTGFSVGPSPISKSNSLLSLRITGVREVLRILDSRVIGSHDIHGLFRQMGLMERLAEAQSSKLVCQTSHHPDREMKGLKNIMESGVRSPLEKPTRHNVGKIRQTKFKVDAPNLSIVSTHSIIPSISPNGRSSVAYVWHSNILRRI